MSNKDGGPAFPIPGGGVPSSHGMTLRDYFAGQALAGMLANSNKVRTNIQVVENAWRFADEMLIQRDRQKISTGGDS